MQLDAIPDCTELIRRNPQDAVAFFNRGYIYGELGEFDAAIADFTKAIAAFRQRLALAQLHLR